MKGLILKDFYVMRQGGKTYLLLLAMYAVMTFMGMFKASFFCGIMAMLVMMVPISGFSYDDLSRWDKFAVSLPVGRKGIVKAKYLFTLCVAALTLALGALVCCGLYFFGIAEESLGELMVINLACVLAGLLFNAILTPLIFKFGAEKSRVMIFIIFGAVFFCGFIFARTGISTLPGFENIFASILLPVLSVPFTALFLALSYLAACRIYLKKEL